MSFENENVRYSVLTNELSYYKISPNEKKRIESEVKSWACGVLAFTAITALVLMLVAINSFDSYGLMLNTYKLMKEISNQTKTLVDAN
jgi:hypothetical protein